MREGYYVIRTIRAGAVGEKEKFFIPGKRPTRSAKRLKTEIDRQELNDKAAVRRLARVLNCNFRAGRDVLLTLDYAVEPLAPEVAERNLRNYLDRCRRACRADGTLLRYVAVTSDMDGETGEIVRLHHHLVVSADAAEVCRKKWTLGGAHEDVLYGRDLTPLADYLLRQVRRSAKNAPKYTVSRNMASPDIRDRIVPSASLLSCPRGSVELYRGVHIPGRPQYVRYLLPRDRSPELCNSPGGRRDIIAS